MTLRPLYVHWSQLKTQSQEVSGMLAWTCSPLAHYFLQWTYNQQSIVTLYFLQWWYNPYSLVWPSWPCYPSTTVYSTEVSYPSFISSHLNPWVTHPEASWSLVRWSHFLLIFDSSAWLHSVVSDTAHNSQSNLYTWEGQVQLPLGPCTLFSRREALINILCSRTHPHIHSTSGLHGNHNTTRSRFFNTQSPRCHTHECILHCWMCERVKCSFSCFQCDLDTALKQRPSHWPRSSGPCHEQWHLLCTHKLLFSLSSL